MTELALPGVLMVALLLSLPGSAPAEEANMTGTLAHPCLLVNAETLPRLRARCADTTPDKFGFKTADIWGAIKQKTDRLMALPTYSYQVAIPGEGDVTLEDWSYTLSDQTPPRHDKSPQYPPWTAMFQERGDAISTRLIHFSFAYLVTGEERYFVPAREIALHLAKWSQWTDYGYGAGAIKACLDTGHCTYSVALFYDWCFAKLTAAERAELRQAIIGKGIQPILGFVDHYPPDTNGFTVLLSGSTLGALAVRPEEPRAGEYLTQCLNRIRVALDRGGKDGGTFEGPMYGTYLLDSLALCFDALTSARVTHDLFAHPYLATMPRYCLGLLAPDTKQIPCFSDGSPGVAVPRLMSILAQRGSKEAAYYLQLVDALRPEGIYDFVRFDAAGLDPQPPTWNPSTVFTDIGYASLRDGFNAQAPSLFFKSGPTSNRIGHNHFDHNSFVISYGGQWIVPDRGYHNFYVPPKRKFSLGTIGHCSVVLDVDDAWLHNNAVPSLGHDQVNVAGGRIAQFFAGDGFDYVLGEAAAPYNSDKVTVLSRFSRSIVYVKPSLFVVRDELAAPEPHAYNFLLHSDGTGEIMPEGELFRLVRTHGPVFARILSSQPTTPHIGTYPGAESYGPFLRLETDKTAATTFTACLIPQPYQNPRFLRNGGFEQGMAGWLPRANEDLPHHTIVGDKPAEGAKCARVERSGYYYSDRFRLPAGTRVTARVMMRAEATPEGKGATMHLYFWKTGQAFANVAGGPFKTAAWTEQTISGVVPPGTEEICLALEYFAPGVGYFDDVRIETDASFAPGLIPEIKTLGSDGLDVVLGQERYVIACGGAQSSAAPAGLVTDAHIAVVGLNPAGEPVSAFLQQGTKLLWQGKPILLLPVPATAEARLRDGKLTAQVQTDVAPHAALPGKASLTCGWVPRAATLNGKPAEVQRLDAGSTISAG